MRGAFVVFIVVFGIWRNTNEKECHQKIDEHAIVDSVGYWTVVGNYYGE